MRTALRLRRLADGWWRVVLTVVTVLLLVAVWVALLLRTVEWRAQWLLVLTALVHWVLWLAPVALVLAALNRRFVTAGVAALATVLVLLVQVPPNLRGDPPMDETRSFTVLQANLKLGRADPAALVGLVRRHRVGLLATEELTDSEATRLRAAGLTRLLPYTYLRPLPGGAGGAGIWSRWPLSGQQDVPGFYLSTVRARVAAPGGPLTFFTVHLTPPWPAPEKQWLAEVPRLHALLRKQPTDAPVIAAGDYNSTTDHAQFRSLLGGGYADAAEDAGEGYLPSYPNDRWYGPVIGIDHVLLRDAFGSAARTLELPGSDHRALLVAVNVAD